MSDQQPDLHTSSWPRMVAAVAVGLLGATFVWAATPYVDIVINCNDRAADMSDGYLPSGVMFFVLLLVLVVNPLLRRFVPSCALRARELAIVFAMMLVGGYMGGDGLMRRLPYSIIGAPIRANQDRQLSNTYEKLDLPASLFPEKLAYGEPTPHGDNFRDKLPAGESIPWGIWVGPLLAWGAFFLSAWLLMVGLAQVLVPQWRDNERLPFPLLRVQQSIIESPRPSSLFAALFRSKAFWVAAGLVFALKFLVYLQRYLPGQVPAVPLEWDLTRCFKEGLLQYLPGYIKQGYLFFIIIGISFFMTTRITFSVWFFAVAYAIYQMVGTAYFPPYHGGTVGAHRNGAAFGLTIAVLWLGRRHLAHVLGLLFRRAETEQDHHMRKALIMFLAGCAGMFSWMLWLGLPAGWALFFVAFVFTVSLLVMRLVAETGLPFSQALIMPQSFMYLAPVSWITPLTAWFAPAMWVFFGWASVANPAALASHALQLDPDAAPKKRWRLSLLLIVTLSIGMVVCGGVHIYANYHHNITMDGLERPLNPFFFDSFNYFTGGARKAMDGLKPTVPYNRPAHMAFGAALAGGLEWAALSSPHWPLHPIGLLVLHSWYINRVWVSIFFGWLLKILILRYGGGRLYRAVTPFFLGLIVGDVLALIFWGLAPAAAMYLGWLP